MYDVGAYMARKPKPGNGLYQIGNEIGGGGYTYIYHCFFLLSILNNPPSP